MSREVRTPLGKNGGPRRLSSIGPARPSPGHSPGPYTPGRWPARPAGQTGPPAGPRPAAPLPQPQQRRRPGVGGGDRKAQQGGHQQAQDARQIGRKPSRGPRETISRPTVSMIRRPPRAVPAAMAAAHSTISQRGTRRDLRLLPPLGQGRPQEEHTDELLSIPGPREKRGPRRPWDLTQAEQLGGQGASAGSAAPSAAPPKARRPQTGPAPAAPHPTAASGCSQGSPPGPTPPRTVPPPGAWLSLVGIPHHQAAAAHRTTAPIAAHRARGGRPGPTAEGGDGINGLPPPMGTPL